MKHHYTLTKFIGVVILLNSFFSTNKATAQDKVQAPDTIPNEHILKLSESGEWEVAEEPQLVNEFIEGNLLTIDGKEISQEELLFFLQQARSQVLMHFTRDYGTRLDSNFWYEACDEYPPIQMLKEQAITALAKVKALHQMMQQYDVDVYSDFNDFTIEWNRVNKEREWAVKEGRVIYGPIAYKKKDYYSHSFNTGVLKLRRAMERDILKIPKSVQRNYYEQNYNSFRTEYIVFESLKLPMDFPADLLESTSNEDLQKYSPNNTKIDTLNYELTRIYDETAFDLLTVIKNTEIGKYSEAVKRDSSWLIVKPISKFLTPCPSFEQVSQDIVQILQDERFDNFLSEKTTDLEVVINHKMMDELCSLFIQRN